MDNLNQDFKGKVAIVTGGASGIGEAVAQAIANRGGQVVIADIDEKDGERAVASITKSGGVAKFIKTDVSKAEANEAMVKFAVESYGGLDIAVNNAGIGGPLSETGEYPLDGWQKVIDINLTGVFYGMRYEILAMLARGGGSIVNVASILARSEPQTVLPTLRRNMV